MPDVPAHHVGDRQRALHHRADRVALVDVFPEPGLGAAAAVGGVLGLDARRSRRRCSAPSSMASYFFFSRALLALGADHQPVLPRQHRAVVVAEHVAPTTRAPPDRRTRSACRAPPPARCGARSGGRAAAAPTTRARSPSRTRARPATGRPSSTRAGPRATAVTSSSPMSESPPTSGGGAIGPPHTDAVA